ncbi:hypothetical protein CDAR_189021, partial [Caerostris darwini]
MCRALLVRSALNKQVLEDEPLTYCRCVQFTNPCLSTGRAACHTLLVNPTLNTQALETRKHLKTNVSRIVGE